MWFNVSLMDWQRAEFSLYDNICLCKTCFDISRFDFKMFTFFGKRFLILQRPNFFLFCQFFLGLRIKVFAPPAKIAWRPGTTRESDYSLPKEGGWGVT